MPHFRANNAFFLCADAFFAIPRPDQGTMIFTAFVRTTPPLQSNNFLIFYMLDNLAFDTRQPPPAGGIVI
jgi:hypothetical protein